jgi:Uma2 family endonuclease
MVAVGISLKRNATYADLEALPEDVIGQIVGGELYASPRPAAPHQLTVSSMGMDLGGPFHKGRGGPGGWWILHEAELHLGGDVVVPDLAGWRRERMPSVPLTPAIELPPDWLCEVISPSTAVLDRGPKLRLYARVGVRHVWFVDPLAQSLEILRLTDGLWTLVAVHGRMDKVHAEPFEAVELDLAGWWASPEPPAV